MHYALKFVVMKIVYQSCEHLFKHDKTIVKIKVDFLTPFENEWKMTAHKKFFRFLQELEKKTYSKVKSLF